MPDQTSYTAKQAVEYIENTLTNGELHTKETCKELGWSFPRVRSRMLTIAKKLDSTLTKRARGVYYLEPHTTPEPADITEAADIVSDAVVDAPQEEDNNTLDPAAVEAAIMGSTPSLSTWACPGVPEEGV